MYKVENFRVVPNLPKELEYLKELAYNLYWSWDHNSQALFRRLDAELWEASRRNPIVLLGNVSQDRLEKLSKDEGYISQISRVKDAVESYMSRKTWFEENHAHREPFHIAYFSMEYGLTGGLPIYSGGLGILAADHLKSASDLGLPFTAVGLSYQHGYFQQYLSNDGWQQETYPTNDFYNLPMTLVRDEQEKPILVSVEFPGRTVFLQIWKVQVGRVPLYLLDSNVQENAPADCGITGQLYGGDDELRIKQEILLGIGGVRALNALGIKPEVCHMNEGHSAFLALERIRMMMEENPGMTFSEAREVSRGGNVFTTHTPVPAGIDEFNTSLLDPYLANYIDWMNLTIKEFHELGGTHYPQTGGKFNMAIFAINMAGAYNGVSKLHGEVARKMWRYLWPEVLEDDVPIGHITNGTHIRTWISEDMAELFNRYLGLNWYRNPVDQDVWKKIDQIPDEELWRTHERRRERLVAVSRQRLEEQLVKSGASKRDIDIAAEVLNPEALTIGFARRFAQYKRAFLLFTDKERLRKILNNKDRPVQILISGKAHPRDRIGKGIIKDILTTIRDEDFRHKIVFLENYDMKIASYLVQGADVWLNNPRRPREASGTSGMKAGANGALNLSVLDGWWDEAYTEFEDIGWAIGRGEEYEDHDEQDRIEAEALYHILENMVVPAFYNRGKSGIPREWIAMMKNSMKGVCPTFNTNRMVRDYLNRYYVSAADSWTRLNSNGREAAKSLIDWRSNVTRNWDHVRIVSVNEAGHQTIKTGEKITISASVDLASLEPKDVCVEVYYGKVNEHGKLEHGKGVTMTLIDSKSRVHNYKVELQVDETGQHGYTVRALPFHEDQKSHYELGLIKWYNP